MIEGVPSHIWTRDTAAELLGSGCLVDSLALEIANREDLSLFKLRAWSLIRMRCRWPRGCGCRSQRWLATLRLSGHLPASFWSTRLSSTLADGEWRVLPWTRGVHDARGGAPAGGAPGGSYRQALLGRVGPSDWRIPPMPMGVANAPPRPQPECSAQLVMREAIPVPASVANLTRSVGPLATVDPGQGDVATMELAPTFRLAAEDQSGGAAGQELVVAGAIRALSPVLDQEIGESRGCCQGCHKATEEIGLEVPEIPEETGQVLVPRHAQCHVPRDEGLVGATVQEGELAPGWAPMEEISSGAPLHAVVGPDRPNRTGADPEPEACGEPVSCMDAPRLVERAGCMDVAIPMHAQADLLLPPKEQIAVANIKAFCTGLLKKLAPPLLKEIEAVCGKCAAQDTPRRNTRSSGDSAPQALGITPDGLAVRDEALGQLRQMFDSPIQEPQLRAMATIFGKAVPFDLGMEEASRVVLLA
ncbi:hypothetical protein VPH35_059302 [Triticum aestivum]